MATNIGDTKMKADKITKFIMPFALIFVGAAAVAAIVNYYMTANNFSYSEAGKILSAFGIPFALLMNANSNIQANNRQLQAFDNAAKLKNEERAEAINNIAMVIIIELKGIITGMTDYISNVDSATKGYGEVIIYKPERPIFNASVSEIVKLGSLTAKAISENEGDFHALIEKYNYTAENTHGSRCYTETAAIGKNIITKASEYIRSIETNGS